MAIPYLNLFLIKKEKKIYFAVEEIEIKNNKEMNDAFGKETIMSYIKLRSLEIKEFQSKESFDKTKPISKWEKDNTLDC